MLAKKKTHFDSCCHNASRYTSGNACFQSCQPYRCQQPDVQIHLLVWNSATQFPIFFFLISCVASASSALLSSLRFLVYKARSCLIFLIQIADYRADEDINLPLIGYSFRLQFCVLLVRRTYSASWQFLKVARK